MQQKLQASTMIRLTGTISALLVTIGAVVAGSTHMHIGQDSTPYASMTEFSPTPDAVLPSSGASTGSYVVHCGNNDAGIRNSDNVVVSPGRPGAAHHRHDYVGNMSTNAFSTEKTLLAAPTTCTNGDLSSYYWPVVGLDSRSDGAAHRNLDAEPDADILTPKDVSITFTGSAVAKVVDLPHNLRTATGDAHGYSNATGRSKHVSWSCSGNRTLVTSSYPLCPDGQDTIRTFNFPSCWNGRSIDSPDHRSHLIFPNEDGHCQHGTFPVPQLRLEVTYAIPSGSAFTIDAFSEEHSSPLSEHAHYINLMSPSLMAEAVACINEGRQCNS
jgi:hypothetical protein